VPVEVAHLLLATREEGNLMASIDQLTCKVETNEACATCKHEHGQCYILTPMKAPAEPTGTVVYMLNESSLATSLLTHHQNFLGLNIVGSALDSDCTAASHLQGNDDATMRVFYLILQTGYSHY
jgi:hypothetical protein